LHHNLIALSCQIRFSSAVQNFFKYWLPPLLMMLLIFSASGDARSQQHSSLLFEPFLHWLFPQMTQAHIEMAHHLFRKCGHLTEYAILAILLWRALRQSKTHLPPWSWPRVGGTLLIVFLYATTDEFHQIFVPTRTPMVFDVFIDTAGGTIGLLLIWRLGKWRKHW
jgi:VanZ family protein